MGDIDRIHEVIAEFGTSAECVAQELKLDIAIAVIRHLRDTEEDDLSFANALCIPMERLGAIMHSNANLSLDEVGRIYHAMGLKVELKSVSRETDVPI